MCGSLLVADIPNERQDWFKKWVVEIRNGMSDRQIVKILSEQLGNPKSMKLRAEEGRRLCMKTETQEHYAARFIKIAREYLGIKK